MHTADHERIAGVAAKKWSFFERSPGGYLILSALAGIYLGFGIALIFSVGGPLAAAGSPVVKLVMGVSFGIALTLVIFAGSELFTGNNLIGTIGGLTRSLTWAQVIQLNAWSWLGNLAGSLGLAWLIVQSGVFAKGPTTELIEKVASVKMSLPAWELFVRGILCNWLICLAVWMTGRTNNDTAKILLIFWCLFAFIASGYEHSIANMTIFAIALLGSHPETVSLGGAAYNLLFVTIGNTIAGAVFMALGYWTADGRLTASRRGPLATAEPAE